MRENSCCSTGSRSSVCDRGNVLVFQDIPLGLLDDIYHFIQYYPKRLDEVEDLITNNRLWIERTHNIGTITAEQALDMGCR